MKYLRKFIALLVVVATVIALSSVSASAYTYSISDSDTGIIKNAEGKKFSCSLNMKSTITGGATGAGNYSISSKGTLTGKYPGVKPKFCEKIKYENTYTCSVVGSISMSVGSSGGSVSGSGSSSSRTISETYDKSSYENLYKLNENVSCKAQCWIIYWHYQNASATYTIKINGNPVSTSVSVAANTVIW